MIQEVEDDLGPDVGFWFGWYNFENFILLINFEAKIQ